ncbi:hypothetical protein [Enterococcus sp. LJL90]
MIAIRRFGLVLLILVVGMFVGNLGMENAILIVAPLFIIWFILWDEKKYRVQKRKQAKKDEYYPHYYQ